MTPDERNKILTEQFNLLADANKALATCVNAESAEAIRRNTETLFALAQDLPVEP